jgi:alkylhydroperoxidase family enzyme
LLGYAEKLTLAPASVGASDLDALRREGFSDEAIHDAAQVISYFNYINRVADGLGVDREEWMPEKSGSGRGE